ncbi:hypothetical protein ACHAW6_002327, partial [Cyclotella cf. meneghiniana]
MEKEVPRDLRVDHQSLPRGVKTASPRSFTSTFTCPFHHRHLAIVGVNGLKSGAMMKLPEHIWVGLDDNWSGGWSGGKPSPMPTPAPMWGGSDD